MNIEKGIKIPTRANIVFIMIGVALILLTISILFFYWWMGLLAAGLIDYLLFQECYPNVSPLRAEKIMRSTRIYHSKDGNIPCPIYVIRKMSDKNLDLHYQNKPYRWFLTTSLEFLKKEKKENHSIRIRKVRGVDCFFFTQRCFSDAYVEQEKKTKEMKKAEEEAIKRLKENE